MTKELSRELEDKVREMPESSYGAHKVKVRLKDGTIYHSVFIAWSSEIVKVGDSTSIPFDASDIVEIENDDLG